jgi:hypothetical protein
MASSSAALSRPVYPMWRCARDAATKGTRPPAAGMGRRKGAQNKFTVTLKEAILASFDRVGGIDYLEIQARKNPQAYMSLLSKVLPMQVTGPNDGPIMIVPAW